MKEMLNLFRAAAAVTGGWLGWFMGGFDSLFYALTVFIVMDYVTGVMCAISEKTLSSEAGYKGIFKKVLIIILTGIANIMDTKVIGSGSMLRTAVMFFYISNEGISILENAGRLGLPIPGVVRAALEQMKEKETGEKTNEQS